MTEEPVEPTATELLYNQLLDVRERLKASEYRYSILLTLLLLESAVSVFVITALVARLN